MSKTLNKLLTKEIENLGYSNIKDIFILDIGYSSYYNCFNVEFQLKCFENDYKGTSDLFRLTNFGISPLLKALVVEVFKSV